MKKIISFAAASILCLVLGAAPAFALGDTLTVGIVQSSKTLDPQATTAGVSWGVMVHIYEGLVAIEGGKIVPRLAESWKILDDGLSYEFKIKQGVKFHNGETMTADDVVYTFTRSLGPAGVAIKSLSQYLAEVKKIDDKTVALKSKTPMGEAFLGNLSHPWASILCQKAVEEKGQDYGQYPIGTGKFKVKQWVPDRVEMVRFEDYHAEKAKIKNAIFRAIIESTSRTIELESGAVDVIMDAAPVDINRIKDNPKLEVVSVPSYRSYHFGMDVTKAPWDNPKVRQAVSLALNRPGIIKVVFRGHAESARGPIPSTVEYSNYENAPDFPYAPEKAKQLMKEAGFPNGFKSSLIICDRTDYLGIATVVQNNMKAIGIDMEIKVYEVGAWIDLIRTSKHDPYLNNWGGNAPTSDPFFSMNPLFHSSNIGQTNRYWYTNPKVDDLLEKGVAETDSAKRTSIYKEIWDILNHDLPQVTMLAPMNMYGKVKSLKGVEYAPTVINNFSNAYFE